MISSSGRRWFVFVLLSWAVLDAPPSAAEAAPGTSSLNQTEQDLRSPDHVVRLRALERLLHTKGDYHSLIPTLKAQLAENLKLTDSVRQKKAPGTGSEEFTMLAHERVLLLRLARQMGPAAAPLVPELFQLAVSRVDQDTPFIAGETIPVVGRSAIPFLVDALRIDEFEFVVRASRLLGKIAENLQSQGDVDAIPDLERALSAIEARRESERKARDGRGPRYLLEYENSMGGAPVDPPIRRAIQALKDRKQLMLWTRASAWADAHPWAIGSIAAIFTFLVVWSLTLWVAPLALLRIDMAMNLTPVAEKILGLARLPVRSGYLSDFFVYRPRVLDAWVRRHVNAAREAFARLATVSTRKISVPVPINIDGAAHAELSPSLLAGAFSARRCYLLIHGEGGAGKTTLACRIAFWGLESEAGAPLRNYPMLPVLIEDDLKEPLGQAVRGILQVQLETEQLLPESLVNALLRNGRILVIVDGLTERDEATRTAIRPAASEFLPSTMIVTSRKAEALGAATVVRITPTRISGGRLSNFVGAYLTKVGRREDFDDTEFFAACGDLSRLVGGRDITALLAKLYIDLTIARKDGEVGGSAPRHVHELFMVYLNRLNKRRQPSDPDDATVHQDAKNLAWCCLRETLKPGPVAIDDALDSLGGKEREQRLRYLRDVLGLIENLGPNPRRLRFSLDPIAEHLAAQRVLEASGSNEAQWNLILDKIERSGDGAADCAGFVTALAECIAAEAGNIAVPEKVRETVLMYAGNTRSAMSSAGRGASTGTRAAA
jgi:hypothetical protein